MENFLLCYTFYEDDGIILPLSAWILQPNLLFLPNTERLGFRGF